MVVLTGLAVLLPWLLIALVVAWFVRRWLGRRSGRGSANPAAAADQSRTLTGVLAGPSPAAYAITENGNVRPQPMRRRTISATSRISDTERVRQGKVDDDEESPVNVRTTPLVKKAIHHAGRCRGVSEDETAPSWCPGEQTRRSGGRPDPRRRVDDPAQTEQAESSPEQDDAVVELATLPTIWPMATTAMAFGSRARVMMPAVGEIVVSTACMTTSEASILEGEGQHSRSTPKARSRIMTTRTMAASSMDGPSIPGLSSATMGVAATMMKTMTGTLATGGGSSRAGSRP